MRTTKVILIVIALGCSGDGDGSITDPPADDESLFMAVQSIFTANCAFSGCHAGATPQEGMNLSDGQAPASVVGVPSNQVPRLFRVDPSNPDSSYLVLKLEGKAGLVGGVGTRMPLGGTLTQTQIDTIRTWISEGATTETSG